MRFQTLCYVMYLLMHGNANKCLCYICKLILSINVRIYKVQLAMLHSYAIILYTYIHMHCTGIIGA